MRPGTFERRALTCALLLLSSASCGSNMVEVAVPLPELPSIGQAVVVFVQPSTYADRAHFPIFDHAGRFLGDSEPACWFAVELAPGDYEFYARAGNTAAMRASLVAGRTYFVEVSPGLGFFRTRVQLLPIAPRFATWKKRDDWVAETRSERRIGRSDLDADDVADLVSRGHGVWADYDASDRERRTLYPGDGI